MKVMQQYTLWGFFCGGFFPDRILCFYHLFRLKRLEGYEHWALTHITYSNNILKRISHNFYNLLNIL